MTLPNLTIKYGSLTQVFGSPRIWQDVSIMPARVELAGTSFGYTYKLADFVVDRKLPSEVRRLMLDGYDGPWVRGRIERLFLPALQPAEYLGEKTGFEADFVGVVREDEGSLVGVPFWCKDYYLKTGLMFSEEKDPCPAEISKQVAEAFWNLLLAEPQDLPDYTAWMYHIGAGVWLEFGIASGMPFVEEHSERPRHR